MILICDQSYISNVLIFLDIHSSKGRWMEGGAISIPRMMSRISLCVKEATFTLFFLPWLSQVHGHHRPTLVVWSCKHCPKSPQLWVSDKWFAYHLQIVYVVCCLDSSRHTAKTTSGRSHNICNQPKQCTITSKIPQISEHLHHSLIPPQTRTPIGKTHSTPERFCGQGSLHYQPKQCTCIREILQNYHRFALEIIPTKNGSHLMIPEVNKKASHQKVIGI